MAIIIGRKLQFVLYMHVVLQLGVTPLDIYVTVSVSSRFI